MMGALRRIKLVGAPVPYSLRSASLPDGAITEATSELSEFHRNTPTRSNNR